MSKIKDEGKCLLYDPYTSQYFYMTVDEAQERVNRNPEIYTGQLVSSIARSKNNDMTPCAIMQIKETKDE